MRQYYVSRFTDEDCAMHEIEFFTDPNWGLILWTVFISFISIVLGVLAVEFGTTLDKGTEVKVYASMSERFKMTRYPQKLLVGLGILLFMASCVIFFLSSFFLSIAISVTLATL